jgi:RND family efflux transporter MFP subunit
MFTWIRTHKLAVVFILLVLVAGWYFFGRKPTVVYDEYTVKKGDINETLELSGKVSAEKSASLKFLAGGLITYLGPKEGDTVKKWQTLASIDTRQVQKTLEQKLNLYKSQLNTFDDVKDGYKDEIESKEIDDTVRRVLERNQFSLENSVKDVEYLDLTLKLSRISSPMSGVLVQSPITTAGVQVTPTDAWIVVDPSTLYLSADLDETDLRRVSIGQKVIVSLDAYPELDLHSTITSISYSPKETTTGTTYEVKISLSQDDMKNLRLGLNGTAAIVLSEKAGVVTLPSSAISNEGGRSFVYIKSDNKYIEKDVQTGIENGGVIEIIGGVSEGDHVYAQK